MTSGLEATETAARALANTARRLTAAWRGRSLSLARDRSSSRPRGRCRARLDPKRRCVPRAHSVNERASNSTMKRFAPAPRSRVRAQHKRARAHTRSPPERTVRAQTKNDDAQSVTSAAIKLRATYPRPSTLPSRRTEAVDLPPRTAPPMKP